MLAPPPWETVHSVVVATERVVAGLIRVHRSLTRWWTGRQPPVSYVTERLDLVLDITDRRGRRAVLRRRHQVRFVVGESGVLHEPVWGEGESLVGYRSRGARRLGVRSEGQTRAVLLALARPPAAGERVTVTSRRTIRDGLLRNEEYLAAQLERPTDQVDLHVYFPRVRPPQAGYLVCMPAQGPPRRLPLRISRDGRPMLACQLRKPAHNRTYLLRWSW